MKNTHTAQGVFFFLKMRCGSERFDRTAPHRTVRTVLYSTEPRRTAHRTAIIILKMSILTEVHPSTLTKQKRGRRRVVRIKCLATVRVRCDFSRLLPNRSAPYDSQIPKSGPYRTTPHRTVVLILRIEEPHRSSVLHREKPSFNRQPRLFLQFFVSQVFCELPSILHDRAAVAFAHETTYCKMTLSSPKVKTCRQFAITLPKCLQGVTRPVATYQAWYTSKQSPVYHAE